MSLKKYVRKICFILILSENHRMKHFINTALLLFLLITILMSLSAFADNQSTPEDSANTPLNFLSLADIHFDPFAHCENVKPCPLITKLRQASAAQWPSILSHLDIQPPQLKQDTNAYLLNSALAASKQAAIANQAQFVLILGDSLGHDYKREYKRFSGDQSGAGYRSFVRKTLEFLTQQLSLAFPSVDVYMAVGNNDSYQGNYITNADGLFYQDTANIWSNLIKSSSNREQMRKQFSHSGYYSVMLSKKANLRLIVLNTTLFSYKAKGKNLESEAIKQLNWLHAQLQAAKDRKEKVFIAMHIPEGIDFYLTLRTRVIRLMTLWKQPYIQRFETDIALFSAEIAGIFVGHLHSNWMQILSFNNNEIPEAGVASISPIFGNYPGFRVYSYSQQPLQLKSYINYDYELKSGQQWKMRDSSL